LFAAPEFAWCGAQGAAGDGERTAGVDEVALIAAATVRDREARLWQRYEPLDEAWCQVIHRLPAERLGAPVPLLDRLDVVAE